MMRYCIVGGGPSGAFSACKLAALGHKVTLVEQQDTLGGCHRVLKRDGVHTEHGPRVYLGAFSEFYTFLWDELRIPRSVFTHSMGFLSVAEYVENFTPAEVAVLVFSFCKHLFLPYVGLTVQQFARDNRFTKRATEALNRVMRTIDGGNNDRSLVRVLFDAVNIAALHGIYQPTAPLDELLWEPLRRRLLGMGATVHTGVRVFRVSAGCVVTSIGDVLCDRIILAVPPVALSCIDNAPRMIGHREQGWAKRAHLQKYETYVCATFLFATRAKKQWGVTSTHPYGDVSIDMGHYFSGFGGSMFIVSLTQLDSKDPLTGRTANELTAAELLAAMVHVTKARYGISEEPYRSVLSPNAWYNTHAKRWEERDHAFLLSPPGWLRGCEVEMRKNQVWVVSHANGNSVHTYNCIESAIQNARVTLSQIEPGFTAPRKNTPTLGQALFVLFAFVFAVILFFKTKSTPLA